MTSSFSRKQTLIRFLSSELDECSPTTSIANKMASKPRKAVPEQIEYCTAELERILWRKDDFLVEKQKLERYLKTASHSAAELLASNLGSVSAPATITVKVISLDGSCHSFAIQPTFVKALDKYDLGVSEHNVQTMLATVEDLKYLVQDRTGVPACSQMLYTAREDDCLLDEDATIEDLRQNDGIQNGHTFFLVVDHDNIYWSRHQRLVQAYGSTLAQGYKSLRSLLITAVPTEQRRRTMVFMKTCRHVLAFVLEKRGSHTARSIEMLDKVERHILATILPILEAVAKRFSQIDHEQAGG